MKTYLIECYQNGAEGQCHEPSHYRLAFAKNADALDRLLQSIGGTGIIDTMRNEGDTSPHEVWCIEFLPDGLAQAFEIA